MSIEQLKAFLGRIQDESTLRDAALAAATADDVASGLGVIQ
jgi:hypothetical protein